MIEFITLEDAIVEEPVTLAESDVKEGNLYAESVLSSIKRDPETLSEEEKALVKDLALSYAYYRAYLRETVNDAGAYAVKVKRYKELYKEKEENLKNRLFDWNITIQRG